MNLVPATVPTMYFVGVTTKKSSIMKVFPEWAKALGIDAVMKGIDIAIHEKPEVYREVVDFIKNDPMSMGALVTTHKIDLYDAAKDLFEVHGPLASRFGELSSISKQGDKLAAHAKDPITSGLSLLEFVPDNYFADTDAEVFIMGAGGSAISMGYHLMQEKYKGNYPSKIVIANRSQPRLTEIENIYKTLDPGGIEFEYYLTPEPGQNDEVLHSMKEGSIIVNATGLGKDRPGSPLTDDAVFPKKSLVWEINYRGDLRFLHQAEEQQEQQELLVEDGWKYFVYGWTSVISEVFHMPIEGETFKMCDEIASGFRQ
ncbi:MAG: shikimate dehydrogenase [Clostridia bacterium]|nr:shikimate dehydrogenase [Clostridia bacterium]MBT7121412.1 shikimate dehydrogenase [Clostridia bacterium]